MKKLIVSLAMSALFITKAYALSKEQLTNLQIAYSIGKITKGKDGMTFEKAMASMMLTESSAGVNNKGDDGASLGPMQMQLATIRDMQKRIKELSWLSALSDKQIKEKLINSTQFSCILAGFYIRHNYNYAVKQKMWNPYFKSISRYNGGWNNKEYYGRVMKNMKIINKLIAEGKLK